MTPTGIQMDAFADLLPADRQAPLAAAEALDALKAWAAGGALRHLDAAFAAFVADLAPGATAPVLVAAALLTHMEGRGHTCLVLDEVTQRAGALLGWNGGAADAWAALAARLPADTAAWHDALAACGAVEVVEMAAMAEMAERGDVPARPGAPGDAAPPSTAATPLVLAAGRLYLRRYWADERRVAAHVRARVAHEPAADPATVRHWLDALFPDEAAFDWQKFACAVALRARLSVVTGGPGTGKTYTAARLLALLWAVDPAPDRLRIALAAPTGKAAARLKQSISRALAELQGRVGDALRLGERVARLESARTLHALLGARAGTRRFQRDAAHPLDVDVLLVDEASMVHLEMMAALLDALPAHARVVLLGDKDQLASVEAGAVLGDLCRGAERGGYDADTAAYARATTGHDLPAGFTGDAGPLARQTVMLRRSRRFDGAIGQLALAVNEGDAARAASLLRDPGQAGELGWPAANDPTAAVRLAVAGYGACFTAVRERAAPADVLAAFDRFRLLCAVRDGAWGVTELNAAVQRALAADGLLKPSSDWYEGRPVMVTRNIADAGIFNGDIGIALRVGDDALRVFFADGEQVRSVGVSRLADVETAFAMTVHKSQGSEFEHTALVLPDTPSRVLTRELVYTGITRARKRFTLVTGRERVFAEALGQRTVRFSGLLDSLHVQASPSPVAPRCAA